MKNGGQTCFHKNVHNEGSDIIAMWQILIR
jgi:hypothetical protein